MKRRTIAIGLLGAGFALTLLSGCPPRNAFSVRIVNDANDAAVVTLKLDNTNTQGADSADLLEENVDPGQTRRVAINVDDAAAAGANAVIIAGIRTEVQIVVIQDATVPVAFVAGDRITITVTRQGDTLLFGT